MEKLKYGKVRGIYALLIPRIIQVKKWSLLLQEAPFRLGGYKQATNYI